MIEDELASIDEKLSKEGVKLSNIIKRISNDYSSLEQRDQDIVQAIERMSPVTPLTDRVTRKTSQDRTYVTEPHSTMTYHEHIKGS